MYRAGRLLLTVCSLTSFTRIPKLLVDTTDVLSLLRKDLVASKFVPKFIEHSIMAAPGFARLDGQRGPPLPFLRDFPLDFFFFFLFSLPHFGEH